MKLNLEGKEQFDAPPQELWDALIDPEVLTKCIPGCRKMTEIGPDSYVIEVQLKVAAVGGSFEGAVSLHDKNEPESCRIKVSGEGSLGTGEGQASFTITPTDDGGSELSYYGEGEVGGLVAGVGQRILKSVSRHLVKQFFTGLKKHFSASDDVSTES